MLRRVIVVLGVLVLVGVIAGWLLTAPHKLPASELAAAATTAGKSANADEFKTNFKAIGATCKSCHDAYRAKKS